MTTYQEKYDMRRMNTTMAPNGKINLYGTIKKEHSSLYSLGLLYLSASIIFEFIDQFAFIRLLGINEVTQALLLSRLFVDICFVAAALYFGINGNIFSGFTIGLFALLTAAGLTVGIINQNEIIEIGKDVALFILFLFKFAVFKQIFICSTDTRVFYNRLVKYCKYTLYVGILSLIIMYSLIQLGFLFYTQGISNLDWYLAYAVSTNKPFGAILGLAIAFLLAKRMVVLSCIVIFLFWFTSKFIRGNPIVFFISCISGVLIIIIFPFVSFDYEALNYAIRFDYTKILYDLQNFSIDALLQVLMTLDTPRYLESMSALDELEGTGFWLGGGFGFEYMDVYTEEIVTNAHFSPVGAITKFGIFGMLLFYSIFVYGAAKGLRKRHPIANICGYYLLATIFGSLLAWKFFLSSPLLPMALAAAIHCRGTEMRAQAGVK